MTSQLDRLWCDEWGRLVALLVARTRRLDLVEDALAEAFERAATGWPDSGVPSNPAGWLYTTAYRRILDQLRAEAVAARTMPLLAIADEHRRSDNDASSSGEDLLRLVLLAAHPALTMESGAALTLRLVLGVSTADIARLFLVSEATMAARLTRARKKVVAAGIPLALPDPELLPERLDVVAQVAYLAFTAGYAPGSGPDVVRVELAGEAIRLVRLVLESSALASWNTTLRALLALMLCQHSRRAARVDGAGELVLLADQDRSAWDRAEIYEAQQLVTGLTGAAGRVQVATPLAASYLLQALIAAEHVRAERAEDTDWSAIAVFYAQLEVLTGSPVVRMNRAVALAETGEVDEALMLLDGLDAQLPTSHRLPAVRADLLRRCGDRAGAEPLWELAIARCANHAERAALQRRRDAGP